MRNTRNTNSTGWGLCIVKAITEEHSETINQESLQGHETTFYFYLNLPLEPTITNHSAHQLTQSQ